MTFLKIRKKVEKIDENKTDKKFIGKVILIFIFILVNFLVLYSILNSDDFFKENDNNLENCEFLISNSIFKRIKENKIKIKVLDTN